MSKKILVFAPHNDDEIIGVGGTIRKYVEKGDYVTVCEITSGNNAALIQSEARKAHQILEISEEIFMGFPVVKLNEISRAELNKAFSEIVQKIKPEILFIPHSGDMHLDHRVVADTALVAARPIEAPFVSEIYAYETLSETEWNAPTVNNAFIPNTWCDISNEIDKKLEAMECFQSQLRLFPHPRSIEAIRALAQYRGSTIGAVAAEAFICLRKKL